MKSVFHKKKWNSDTVQVHVYPPLIPIIKSKNGDKSDKHCVKIKLRRDPTLQKLNLYKFKIDLFDNGDP